MSVTASDRFRTTYRQLSHDEQDFIRDIKSKATELETLFGQIDQGRFTALALTNLEQSVMWAVKGITG